MLFTVLSDFCCRVFFRLIFSPLLPLLVQIVVWSKRADHKLVFKRCPTAQRGDHFGKRGLRQRARFNQSAVQLDCERSSSLQRERHFTVAKDCPTGMRPFVGAV